MRLWERLGAAAITGCDVTDDAVQRMAGRFPDHTFLRRVPMLVLMNTQVDVPLAWRKSWGGALRAVTATEPTGRLTGAALHPLERRPVRGRRESPTRELLNCRLCA